jgi:hypothetical protein
MCSYVYRLQCDFGGSDLHRERISKGHLTWGSLQDARQCIGVAPISICLGLL